MPEAADAPTMLIPDERKLLFYLASKYYTGAGAIVDGGCFLGGSTTALAAGLEAWMERSQRPPSAIIHSFDLFEVEAWTIGVYFPLDTRPGASFRHLYDANVSRYAGLIEVHSGDIRQYPWSGGPIEILFIDCAKHPTVCDFVTRNFFAALIPGHSIVIQQDYLYHTWTGWLQVTMEYYSDYFEIITDTTYNSVAFLYTRKIPDDRLRCDTIASLSIDDQRRLMDRAGARFTGKRRSILNRARDDYLELLREGKLPPLPAIQPRPTPAQPIRRR